MACRAETWYRYAVAVNLQTNHFAMAATKAILSMMRLRLTYLLKKFKKLQATVGIYRPTPVFYFWAIVCSIINVAAMMTISVIQSAALFLRINTLVSKPTIPTITSIGRPATTPSMRQPPCALALSMPSARTANTMTQGEII